MKVDESSRGTSSYSQTALEWGIPCVVGWLAEKAGIYARDAFPAIGSKTAHKRFPLVCNVAGSVLAIAAMYLWEKGDADKTSSH